MIYFYVGLGGMIGASLRFLIGVWLKDPDLWFPYSTLTVNLTGSFLLAWFTMGLVERYSLSATWKAALGTGLVGSFTTFSTLSMDAVSLYENGDLLLSLVYIVLSISGGLLMSTFGFKLGKRREV